jgi:hypothetical protein
VSKEKLGAAMEHITLIIITAYSGDGTTAKFQAMWIGQEEVPIEGRSIAQILEEMQRQGWSLTSTRAGANQQGILCEYHFQRTMRPATRAD